MVRDLAAQGIRHAEVYISFGILYRFARLDVDEVFAAIERGRTRGEAEFGTTVLWLIDAVRHFGVEAAAQVFRKAAELHREHPSVAGIGIGGDEARGPADDFRELYAEAKLPASISPPTPAKPPARPPSGLPSTSAPNASATPSPRS